MELLDTGVFRVKCFLFNQFQPSVALHIEIDHLICRVNQRTGFYMKCNTGLKWIKEISFLISKLNQMELKIQIHTFRINRC